MSNPAKPRRVLQLVTHDKMGGIRTLVEMVSDGLMARGYEVETLAFDHGGGLRGAVSGLFSTSRAIVLGRYDAVLTYQAAASVIGNALAALRGIAIRAAHQTAAPEGIRPHWKLLDRLLGSAGIYTDIISNSDATTASFSAWPASYKKRFTLISHGVTAIPPAAGAIDWRQRCRIPAYAPVLIATGRLVEQKNYGVAIRAMQLLPAAHLIIAGDGPLRLELEALAASLGVAPRVHMIGSMDRTQLGDVLAAGQVYVFPSVWETFGLAGVEAAFAGLPVVAADLPVLREVLEPPGMPEGCVRFHRRNDAESLAAQVQAVLADYPAPDTRRSMAAFQRAHHDPVRMLDLYDAFLKARLNA